MRIFSTLRYSFILLAMLCASCGTAIPTIKPYKMDVQQGNVVTSKMLLQLRPGMTKSQVRFIMGTPLIQDSFHGNRWDYVYQLREKGKITEQRRVILDFEKDLLKTVRGDVIPKAGEQDEVKPNTGTRVIEPAGEAQKKSLIERLKFWKNDDPESTAKAATSAASATAAVAEKSGEIAVAAPAALVETTSSSIAEKPAVITEQAPTEVQVSAIAADTPKSVLVQDIQLPLATPASSLEQPATQIEAAAKAPVQKAEIVDGAALTNDAVVKAVNDWAQAWRTKNVNQYLGFYADKFKPDAALSKKAWVAQRKQRLSDKQGEIGLVLENTQAQVQGQQATVQFLQKYQSKQLSDRVTKQLTLEFDAKLNRWLIVKETVLQNVQTLGAEKVSVPTQSTLSQTKGEIKENIASVNASSETIEIVGEKVGF